MTRIFLIGFSIMLAGGTALLSGCGQNPSEVRPSKPVVTVNQLELTEQELREELKTAALPVPMQAGSAGEEPEWLSRVIERELLVQEAQRLGLDRQPDFMRMIERFWKGGLIKLLLNRKGQEIGDKIRVYEPEIEAYYQELVEEAQGQPVEPLPALRSEIERTLREKKQADEMDRWISELREKAKVMVDREAVSQLK